MDSSGHSRRSGHRRASVGIGLIAVLAIWAGGHAGPVQGATDGHLTGSVHVVSRPSRRLATPGAYPNRTVRIANRTSTPEVENVVVFVRASSSGAPRAMTASILQRGEEFLPHVTAVTVGSTVEFPNDDPFFHNVFSLSRAATFDLGRYPRGESRLRTFTKPGIVKVFCHIHSHMSALVRVFDHPYFAIPDETGQFEIGGLPAGRYEVVAWHERAGEVADHITIEAGSTANLSFSLPVTDDDR